MSEQGTGGARENRAVIFGEGRIPGAKTFVLMEFEGREACVFVDRRVDRRWREFTRFCFTVYFISPSPESWSFAVKRQLSYFIAAFAVVFQKIYIAYKRKKKGGEKIK